MLDLELRSLPVLYTIVEKSGICAKLMQQTVQVSQLCLSKASLYVLWTFVKKSWFGSVQDHSLYA